MLVRGSFRAQARSELPIAIDQKAETPSGIVSRLVHLHPVRVGTADENEIVTAMLDWQLQVLEFGVKGLWLMDFKKCDGYRYHGWTDPASAVLRCHSCKDEFAGPCLGRRVAHQGWSLLFLRVADLVRTAGVRGLDSARMESEPLNGIAPARYSLKRMNQQAISGFIGCTSGQRRD